MARIASVVTQGSHPAPSEAIAGILRHLKIPAPPPDPTLMRDDVNIIDPCAGEAKALVQLAEGLGVSWGHVFAIELNASRSARITEAYPDIHLLGPCSFEATRIARYSFSLVYLNVSGARSCSVKAKVRLTAKRGLKIGSRNLQNLAGRPAR
jgi:hypothetical protein